MMLRTIIYFSETGHLILSTLNANNSNQALERMINFKNFVDAAIVQE